MTLSKDEAKKSESLVFKSIYIQIWSLVCFENEETWTFNIPRTSNYKSESRDCNKQSPCCGRRFSPMPNHKYTRFYHGASMSCKASMIVVVRAMVYHMISAVSQVR